MLCGPDLFYDPLDFDALDALIDKHFNAKNLRIDLVAPLADQPLDGNLEPLFLPLTF